MPRYQGTNWQHQGVRRQLSFIITYFPIFFMFGFFVLFVLCDFFFFSLSGTRLFVITIYHGTLVAEF